MNKSVHIRVLYSEGCPNASPVIDLIEKVGKEIGVPIDVEPVLVTSPEMAVELRCLGSPTVQINGVDIDPEARGSMAFGLG
ncbi:MAG TPA: hypothetical protein VEI57_18965 [Nitrospirota bacterium]|nr:hypothetical protein [Nitrospirota bacterium]